MSALTLMSVIAPSAPNAPQGPSGEDASGFQDLLTALSGEDTAAPTTKGGASDTGTSDTGTPVDAVQSWLAETLDTLARLNVLESPVDD